MLLMKKPLHLGLAVCLSRTAEMERNIAQLTSLAERCAQTAEVDAWLWPVHCDYDAEAWASGTADEYRARSAILGHPVALVNNIKEGGAEGGAWLWQLGREKQALTPGQAGILRVELEKA